MAGDSVRGERPARIEKLAFGDADEPTPEPSRESSEATPPKARLAHPGRGDL